MEEEREWEESNDSDEGFVVAVAVPGGRKSRSILKWAVDKFLPESNGTVNFKLLHVYPKVTSVPTNSALGIWSPIAQVRSDIAAGYIKEIESKKKKQIIPYQDVLTDRMLDSDIIMLESNNVAMAITSAIERHSFRHLVVGVSSNTASIFSRKNIKKMLVDSHNLSAVISETAPDFCSVYVISDGKLQHMREATSEPPTLINIEDITGMSTLSPDTSPKSSSLGNLLKSGASSPTYRRQAPLKSITFKTTPEFHPINKSEFKKLPRESSEMKRRTYSDVKAIENASFDSQGSSNLGSWTSNPTSSGGSFVATPQSSFVSTPPSGSSVGTPPKGGSYVGTQPSVRFIEGTPPMGSFVDTPPNGSIVNQSTRGSSTGASPHEVSQQLETLRTELRRIEHMYEHSQNSDINETPGELSKKQLEEAVNKKEEANKLASTKNSIPKNAQNAGTSDLGLQSSKSREERKVARQAKEDKTKAKQLVSGSISQYQKFTWEEIVTATSSFSEEFNIGKGAFGTVYKCKLHHTTVAVKVLHCKNKATDKQFLSELEILSSIRHPHLLLLLGAVPQENCLVYEYMENGSLEDRLFRRGDKPPLLWYDRFRICWEVASSLTFLHSTKPQPIIHRDLKPANILLDQNLVSKIGDAGLGTMLNVEQTSASLKTVYKETSPVGTFCYIDPEYQRTGRVSTKSDVYALGVVILQLLTAKPAVGVAYIIEDAIDEGNMMEMLDEEAGEWPEEETYNLAKLGLQCAELRGRDRPDLRQKVLPLLEKFKEIADKAKESASRSHTAMPTHFICPILKDIMEDPYVAADGYTYDRRAIEKWLTENDTSPTTNLPLPHKFIMPNYTLLEAVNKWKAKTPTK